MSFNIVSILKSSSLPKELTLENLYNYASELSSIQGDNNFFIGDLANFINNRNSPVVTEPVYTGSDDDWVFSSPNRSNPNTDFPYHNDIHLHKGYHHCSRPCTGAKFLCGNSFFNKSGGLTKCGHISYPSSSWTHECRGSYDLFFLPNGRPNRTIKSSHRRRSNAFIKFSSDNFDPYYSSDDEYFPDGDH